MGGGRDIKHIFCDNDPFCQQVLKKHWPDSKIYGDIRQLTKKAVIADADRRGHERPHVLRRRQHSTARNNEHVANAQGRQSGKQAEQKGRKNFGRGDFQIDILTGGFPCQPFSQAGKRQGKNDDRYLWPEMLRVIKEFKPTWIVGENVAGILNMAQQQSDTDLETEDLDDGDADQEPRANGIIWGILNDLEQAGYSVQTFVIPACAVNAPHRRDRVWIVAHSDSDEYRGRKGQIRKAEKIQGINRQEIRARRIGGTVKGFASDPQGRGIGRWGGEERRIQQWELVKKKQERNEARTEGQGRSGHATDSDTGRIQRYQPESFKKGSTARSGKQRTDRYADGFNAQRQRKKPDSTQPTGLYGGETQWSENWLDVATRLCGVDDGLPIGMDGFKLTKAGHRTQRLKAFGNSIVPQVAMEIINAIKLNGFGIK